MTIEQFKRDEIRRELDAVILAEFPEAQPTATVTASRVSCTAETPIGTVTLTARRRDDALYQVTAMRIGADSANSYTEPSSQDTLQLSARKQLGTAKLIDPGYAAARQ